MTLDHTNPPETGAAQPDAGRPLARLTAWILLAPMLVWIMGLVVVPTAILVVYSFCDRDELGRVVFTFTLDNYRRAFDPIYLRIFWRSIGYAGLTTALCIVIGYPVAFFIAKAKEEWRHRLLLLVMVPFWTSFLIRTYAWITILKEEGLLNGLLQLLPVTVAPLDLLYTPTAVVIGLVYAYLPFMILPLQARLVAADPALEAAAADLGATPWQVFLRVTLPLSLPGVYAGVGLVFVPVTGEYVIPALLGAPDSLTIGRVIWDEFFQNRDWPLAASLSLVLLLAVMPPALLLRRSK